MKYFTRFCSLINPEALRLSLFGAGSFRDIAAALTREQQK